MLLMIDNYNSFTYNLVLYFVKLGEEVMVFRNDEITPDEVAKLEPSFIVISPGPCAPMEAGVSISLKSVLCMCCNSQKSDTHT